MRTAVAVAQVRPSALFQKTFSGSSGLHSHSVMIFQSRQTFQLPRTAKGKSARYTSSVHPPINNLQRNQVMKTIAITKMQQIKTTRVALVISAHYCGGIVLA